MQVLKGIPVNEFMGTIGIISAALGMSCEDCHDAGDENRSAYAQDKSRKQMARVMISMMADRQGVRISRSPGSDLLDLLIAVARALAEPPDLA